MRLYLELQRNAAASKLDKVTKTPLQQLPVNVSARLRKSRSVGVNGGSPRRDWRLGQKMVSSMHL